ncbi:hypothetical protein STAS_07932 [Striga asiatica]|uniref:Uncharacterized protein n=1 Tax=Striga asiatica TaxID=4170 RepID=A0A5A7PGK5_STRAF|nr:hypothetical protein STAS_07932 [Striga asiatica]
MEDVITEVPPPSRLLPEDLNNFTPPPSPLPSPFLVFPPLNSQNTHLRPSLLIIAMSSPSLHFLRHLTPKSLVCSLILPETPLAGISAGPDSFSDKSCNVYALGSVFIVLVQCHVIPERAHAVARALLREKIVPERVLILDSVQSRNFRGRLSRDEAVAFKLETSVMKKSSFFVKGLGYYPSGSVVDGLGAALLGLCEVMRIEGTLVMTWPDLGGPVMGLVKDLLVRDVLSGVEYSVDGDYEEEYLKLSRRKDRVDSDLYT